jgi:hypothetical protein
MGPARSAIKAAVYKSGSSSPIQIYWTGGPCYWLTGCELLRNVELLISRNGL